MDIPEKVLQRFWRYTEKRDGCWRWNGTRAPNGYGMLFVDNLVSQVRSRRTMSAHRFSYLLHYGGLPEGMYICHKCDVKDCVNPDHLYAGTPKQNIQDTLERGQYPRGERNGRAKLTAIQVKMARILYDAGMGTYADLAKAYGVNTASMCSAIRGTTWKQVTA